MKSIILVITLLVTTAGAVELGITGGGNYQKWNTSLPSTLDPEETDPVNYRGLSYHAGLTASLGFTKPSDPVFLGMESGLRFTAVHYYTEVDSVYDLDHGTLVKIPRIPAEYNYFNLSMPLMFRISVPEKDWFEWGVALGPVIIFTPEHTEYFHDYYVEWYGQEFTVPQKIDLGVEARAGVEFKVWRNIWIGPSFAIIYNSTPDKSQTPAADEEQFMNLSLRVSYKI